MRTRSVHHRHFEAPVERLRPWIEACWSGTERDPFPRDVIPDWRRNPEGVPADALVPGTTRLGHGPFSFRLRSWDGTSWRVDVPGGGWHGFDLVAENRGCRLTHTLEIPGLPGLLFRAIAPAHDWAVEALFDRIDEALRTGRVGARTARPAPRSARWLSALPMAARPRR